MSYETKHSCKDLNTKILILVEAFLATNYVAAMFHTTIGQCAHQSLSNTMTPNLGMIPQGVMVTLAGSHIAKDTPKLSQANTDGFIRMQRRWKG